MVVFNNETLLLFGGKKETGFYYNQLWSLSLTNETMEEIPIAPYPRALHSSTLANGSMVIRVQNSK